MIDERIIRKALFISWFSFVERKKLKKLNNVKQKKMSQINLKAKKKKKKTWKLYINCKFIGNKPEVKVNKLLKWWWRGKSISKKKKNNKWRIKSYCYFRFITN